MFYKLNIHNERKLTSKWEWGRVWGATWPKSAADAIKYGASRREFPKRIGQWRISRVDCRWRNRAQEKDSFILSFNGKLHLDYV